MKKIIISLAIFCGVTIGLIAQINTNLEPREFQAEFLQNSGNIFFK
jgi:hypothetical protein